MTSIYPSASTDYSVMLQDLSNHVARSQLQHRLSTHSNSTSSSCKRPPARITKQNSAGNSPHNVQRRRTTANTARTCPRLSQSSPYKAQEQSSRNYYGSRQAMPMERPMSWHPGSEMISTPARQIPTSEPALGNTIVGLENLAVSGQPISSVQQPIENPFAMNFSIPMSTSSAMSEHSPTANEEYNAAAGSVFRRESLYNSESMYNPYSYDNTLQQLQHCYMSQSSSQDTYSPANYLPLQWPEPQPYLAHGFQDPQNSADQCNWPSNPRPKSNVKIASQVSKRANKVLSGIGLYDDKVPDFMSSSSSDPNRDSMGKGLKLEETWEPPKDEDDDDDADDDDDEEGSYSTDEAEEIEEDPPIMSNAPQHAQTAFYPPYGDLSQQSFFFSNDDDQYSGEDHQYANFLALGQGQTKPQEPVTGNFLWC